MQRSARTSGSRPYYQISRQRPWAMVSWWYSLIFVVPAVILLYMGIHGLFFGGGSSDVQIHITDSASGQPLQGAIVTVGDQQATSNDKGIALIKRPSQPETIVVQAVNYEAMHGTIEKSTRSNQSVALRSSTVSGVLTDSASGAPIAGARVTVLGPDGPTQLNAVTDANGAYSINNVPGDASLQIDADGYTSGQQPVNSQSTVNASLTLAPSPTAEPTVAPTATPAADGADATDNEASVEVAASPNAADDPGTANLPQVPAHVKGIYLNGGAAADPDVVNNIIDLANTTELNAVVLDIKEGYVYYNTGVKFFQDAGAVQPEYDPKTLIKKFHDNGIYVIGRLVVFNDPVVAAAYPDLAIPDVQGGSWIGADGNPWVNPFNHEIWQANIDLATEAASLGFDEIQYDYVRFPSDGDLSRMNFDNYTMDDRVAAIDGFLKESLPKVHAAGARQSADVFGIITLYDDDQGIGQYLRDIYKDVDFISPMVYPSHFTADSIDVGGQPNDYPKEVIEITMYQALQKMDGDNGKLRPWLQDFTYPEPGYSAYGPDQVRAQIDAAEEYDVEGWMIWNAGDGTDNPSALDPN